jgi:hypothetical protein
MRFRIQTTIIIIVTALTIGWIRRMHTEYIRCKLKKNIDGTYKVEYGCPLPKNFIPENKEDFQ